MNLRFPFTLLGSLLIVLGTIVAATGTEVQSSPGTAHRQPAISLTGEEQQWLKDHPTLRIGYDNDWAPVEYADEMGRYRGITADYMELISELLGVTIEPAPPQSWQATVDSLRAGKLDILSAITRTPQRAEYLYFTDPYLSFPMVIVTDMDVSYINDATMLVGKKVAVVDDYVTHHTLMNNYPGLDLVLVSDIQDGIDAVQGKEVYAFVDGFATVSHILGHRKKLDLKVSGKLPYNFDLAIGIPKDREILVSIMQKALDAIPEEKRIEIFNRWASVVYEKGIDYTPVWRVSVAALLILLVTLYWNHKLRVEIQGRKKAEEGLQMLTLAVEQSDSTIVITDIDGTIEFVNPAFTLSTGYTEQEAIGQNPRLLNSGHHGRDFYLRMWETLRAGNVWRGEMYNRRKDGSCYWEMMTVSPVTDREGQTTHYVAIKEDISKSKAAAKELEDALATAEEMTRRAEEANQAKSAFLANMTHELRTPLNVILGFSRLLERDSNINAEQLDNLKAIHRSGDHLLALINDILDISKIESGKVSSAPAPFDLMDFLHDIEMLFKQRCREKELLFTLEIAPDTPLCISADKGKLRQVLFNLLGNAVNYTLQGRVAMQVSTVVAEGRSVESNEEPAAGEYPHWLRFTISDTGMGIEPEDLGDIFKPFVQVSPNSTQSGGTGLGLSISSNFVEIMGGTLNVESEKGLGSTFWFELPVMVIEEPGGLEKRDEVRAPVLTAGQNGYEILVVDDHRESRLMLARLLRDFGFTVHEALNGQEAVSQCAKNPPDLVLMDINMPVMDGLTATHHIKTGAGEHSFPVIALTAHAFAEERQAILDAGCDDFIAKPFDETDLRNALIRHLGVTFDTGSAHEAEVSPAPVLLAGLPHQLRMDLRDAAIELNQQRTMVCIQKIRALDHHAGDSLQVLAEQFRFDEIRTLVEEPNQTP